METTIEAKNAPITQEPNNDKTNEAYIALEDIKGKIYSDLTGKFQSTSNLGMKYVMIFIFTMPTTSKVY